MGYRETNLQAERSYASLIRSHYIDVWKRMPSAVDFKEGPIHELPSNYRVLEFAPAARKFWTYATCSMSRPEDEVPMELHLFSPKQDRNHAELLTVIAHYHRTASKLGVGHIVNFGRPWLEASECEYGLISLPYLDGPSLELLKIPEGEVRFYWLIPITEKEKEFATLHGLNALEERLEEKGFNYLNPGRASMV